MTQKGQKLNPQQKQKMAAGLARWRAERSQREAQQLGPLMEELKDIVAKADFEIHHNPNFYSVKSAQAEFARNPRKYQGWTVNAADHDGDGVFDDVDVKNAQGQLVYENTYGLFPLRSRRVTNKKNHNRAEYEFYEQNPTRESRKGKNKNEWMRSYLGKTLSPYQSFTQAVGRICKTDPRFQNSGQQGNTIRMRMTPILYNGVVLPNAFPEFGADYPWKTDPSSHKTNKNFKAVLLQRLGKLNLQNLTHSAWNQAYQMASGGGYVASTRAPINYVQPNAIQSGYSPQQYQQYQQQAHAYNDWARQGRAPAANHSDMFVEDEDDSFARTGDDDNQDPAYLALRGRN
jgi:hypothetical protein